MVKLCGSGHAKMPVPAPVSYTHLDVYKRQALDLEICDVTDPYLIGTCHAEFLIGQIAFQVFLPTPIVSFGIFSDAGQVKLLHDLPNALFPTQISFSASIIRIFSALKRC